MVFGIGKILAILALEHLPLQPSLLPETIPLGRIVTIPTGYLPLTAGQ